MGAVKRKVYFLLGWFFVALGIVGIFLPILPTTPFLLLAAFFFGKSSPKWYGRLNKNSYLKAYIEGYRKGVGVEPKIILRSLIFLWTFLLISAFIKNNFYYRLTLLAVGLGVTAHLLYLRS